MRFPSMACATQRNTGAGTWGGMHRPAVGHTGGGRRGGTEGAAPPTSQQHVARPQHLGGRAAGHALDDERPRLLRCHPQRLAQTAVLQRLQDDARLPQLEPSVNPRTPRRRGSCLGSAPACRGPACRGPACRGPACVGRVFLHASISSRSAGELCWALGRGHDAVEEVVQVDDGEDVPDGVGCGASLFEERNAHELVPRVDGRTAAVARVDGCVDLDDQDLLVAHPLDLLACPRRRGGVGNGKASGRAGPVGTRHWGFQSGPPRSY